MGVPPRAAKLAYSILWRVGSFGRGEQRARGEAAATCSPCGARDQLAQRAAPAPPLARRAPAQPSCWGRLPGQVQRAWGSLPAEARVLGRRRRRRRHMQVAHESCTTRIDKWLAAFYGPPRWQSSCRAELHCVPMKCAKSGEEGGPCPTRKGKLAACRQSHSAGASARRRHSTHRSTIMQQGIMHDPPLQRERMCHPKLSTPHTSVLVPRHRGRADAAALAKQQTAPDALPSVNCIATSAIELLPRLHRHWHPAAWLRCARQAATSLAMVWGACPVLHVHPDVCVGRLIGFWPPGRTSAGLPTCKGRGGLLDARFQASAVQVPR